MSVDWEGMGNSVWDFAKSPEGGEVIGGLVGAGLSAASGGKGDPYTVATGYTNSGSQGGSSSSSDSSSWSGTADYMKPYTQGPQGIYPLAQQEYLQGMGQGYIGQTPEQERINSGTARTLRKYITNPDMVAKGMDQAGSFADRNSYSLSGTDPKVQSTMNSFLDGQIDTRGLDAMQNAVTNRAMVGYGDALQDAGNMFTQQIAPSIRSGAMLSGQYGGSRQGVAEGIASGQIGQQMARGARDLGLGSMDVGTQLYNDAYRGARENQYGMSQFGAGFGLEKNEQGMRNTYQNAGMEQQGIGMQDQAMNRYLGGQQGIWDSFERNNADARGGQNFGWDQLANYFNFINGQGQESTAQNSANASAGNSSWGAGTTGSVVDGSGYNMLEGAGYGAGIGKDLGSYLQT